MPHTGHVALQLDRGRGRSDWVEAKSSIVAETLWPRRSSFSSSELQAAQDEKDDAWEGPRILKKPNECGPRSQCAGRS